VKVVKSCSTETQRTIR